MEPDTITVRVRKEEEVDADSANVHVTVEGTSVFSGSEAFKKAKEVQTLVAALTDAGIAESQLKLRSVSIDSQSFSIIKSSSAKYSITVSEVALEKLPAVFGAIAAQKNSNLTQVGWNYSTAKEIAKRLRSEALEEAIAQARQDVETLGVNILGVYSLDEGANRPEVANSSFGGGNFARQRNVDLGFALGNSATVGVRLEVKFRVSPIEQPQ